MGEAFWAAREGDALLHTSLMADIAGGVLDVAINAAIMLAVDLAVGAAIAAAPFTFGASACLAVGLVVGVGVGIGMSASGLSEGISSFCSDVGNAIFPPTVQGHISSGSADTYVNGKRAARAAGILLTQEEIDAQVKAAAEAPPRQQSIIDIAGEALQWGQAFISQMWRPAVAAPEPANPCPDDKVHCEKHPSSITAMAEDVANASAGTVFFNAVSGMGALDAGLKAVSAITGASEYIAEGVKHVTINGQPAARSGARTTCEAKVVDEPASGADVSPDVRIGGPLAVVREIRSGKSPIALMIAVVLAFMGKGSATSKFGCFLFGTGVSVLTQKAGDAMRGLYHRASNAVLQPVNAATGAKYLAGEEDLDFSLPGPFALDWQRVYNSRDERHGGMFGTGWSVPFEVAMEATPGAEDADSWTFIDETGRRVNLQAVRPGQGFRSPGEGLGVRRSAAGHWLVESDEGLYRVFEPDPHNAERQRLLQLSDRNRNALRLHYNDAGRLEAIADSTGHQCVRLHYEEPVHPYRVSRLERLYGEDLQQRDVLVRYRYDADGNLAEVRNRDDTILRQFAYDAGHRMVMHRLPAGMECHYGWGRFDGPDGEEWRVVEHWTDTGEHYWLDYQIEARTLRVRDSLGRSTFRQWDELYQITCFEDELGHVSRFEWSRERQLLAVTDAKGGVWRWDYDEAGRVSAVTDPLGRVEQTQWHPVWALPTLEADTGGNTWRHFYDERGNRIVTIDPLMQRTLYHRDAHGQVMMITDARGGERHLRWNEDGQLSSHTDCSGSVTAFYYDARGALECVTNAEGDCTRYRRDALGRLVTMVHPDGREERFTVDAAGRLLTHSDASGRTTRYQRDRRGLVQARIDGAGHRVGFEYDSYGRLLALVNENGERYGFAYDAKNRLTRQTDLDGRRQETDYDALDQVAAVRYAAGGDAQIEHTFGRDALGRLIGRYTPEAITFHDYDASGNLLTISRKRHDAPRKRDVEVIAFRYDRLGRLLEEATSQGKLRHEYDVLGNRIATTLPDGRTINHLYYGSGHLHQINVDGETVSDFQRDRLHREVLRSQGKLDTRSLYDVNGRLARRQSYRGMNGVVPDRVIDRGYHYDALDRLVSKRHSLQQQTVYRYDDSGRISGCHNEAYWDTLQYDAAANFVEVRERARVKGEPAPVEREGNVVRFNRVLRFRDRRYEYDAHGRTASRLTAAGLQRYRYDAEHRLVEVSIEQTGGPVRRYGYAYDAVGRRVAKFAMDGDGQPFERTRFLWDGMRMVQEVRADGANSLYLYNGEGSYEPVARIDGRNGLERSTYYYHTDINGAPEELTSADGRIVWQAMYQLWGNTVRESEPESYAVRQNLRYQGQYLDRETGLHYNTLRYYDPDIGRFTTPDPIGLAGGVNLYAYGVNPISWIDPWGLSCGPTQAARPTKIVNALRNFRGRKFRFGSETFSLDKSGMKHILERHHPEYWDGSVKAKQSFFDSKMSIGDVSDAVGNVMKQNSSLLESKGAQGMYQIKGTYGGTDYVLGVNNGRIGQFYPE
ncbi:RHS repeat-associated core domain-containing protein [Paraburkholderia xenovorans]|uniref:RHS repeat-associated core domain-containing protein n=1 Tax=Paraburkholderia xenovorans TaxID=36873 RepID=UPI001559B26B|nr:RHS repeat-associated core domain-containing protein [Paraburkholderia xenovorans]NPT38652.1 type IV secretion protein Rhs [Paraburkholderia xenovorans]